MGVLANEKALPKNTVYPSVSSSVQNRVPTVLSCLGLGLIVVVVVKRNKSRRASHTIARLNQKPSNGMCTGKYNERRLHGETQARNSPREPSRGPCRRPVLWG